MLLSRELVSARPVTRFAPSVTGRLHLGHVAHAVFVWGIARALGGRILLRLEDHDSSRCRPEYESAIRGDLEWLGLEYDEDLGRQSDHPDGYVAALDDLASRKLVYACDCTRKDVADAAANFTPHHREPLYSGRCRNRGLVHANDRGMRVKMDLGEETFTDLNLGEQRHDPSLQCGDMLVRNRVGDWTYNFAVVVDDLRHGVDLIIRGEDLLDATGRQLRLASLLGCSRPPVYLHHSLVLDKTTGHKLSKREGAAGLKELRESGMSAEETLGLAAHRVGLLDRCTPIAASKLATLFEVS